MRTLTPSRAALLLAPLAAAPAVAAALAAGCVLERGPPRHRLEGRVFTTVDETEEPGGVITLKPAASNPIDCPHCGEANRLGQSHCKSCGKRLSLQPLRKPCASCEGNGKAPGGERCASCEGTGWVAAPEDGEGAER
ncbi:MAG: hypothetical protein HY721_20275 [Planctomycetes bacterium]|nr:hypothetical protein [Planctomycetota bacterium]